MICLYSNSTALVPRTLQKKVQLEARVARRLSSAIQLPGPLVTPVIVTDVPYNVLREVSRSLGADSSPVGWSTQGGRHYTCWIFPRAARALQIGSAYLMKPTSEAEILAILEARNVFAAANKASAKAVLGRLLTTFGEGL